MKYYPPRYLFRRYELLKRIDYGKEFLEVGPGNLYLTRELIKYFQHGTLVEFNTDVTQLFDQLPLETQKQLDLVVADFQTVSIDGPFDCAIACEVLEHVKNHKEFLTKLHKLLTTNGQLILSVPAHTRYWSVDDEAVGHYRRYERADLVMLLREQKFEITELISYGFPFTNLFRLPRIWLAKRLWKKRLKWNQQRQSQESGLPGRGSSIAPLLGLVLNPTTVYPLSIIASIFNSLDLSDGYLVFARKR